MASKPEPLSRAVKILKAESKAPPVQQESKCIAAIDFGTSSLSVAYTTPITRGDVKVLPLHSTLERIPNAILVKKEQEGKQYQVIGIGHEAQRIYSDLEEDAHNFTYFERIKKLLERDKVSLPSSKDL